MLSENDKIVAIKSLCKTNSSGKINRRIWLFCVFGNRSTNVQKQCHAVHKIDNQDIVCMGGGPDLVILVTVVFNL